MAQRDSDDDEKPLDPAVENVRRRMVRFMAINLGILFVAVMAVVLALVYKGISAPDEPSPVAAAPSSPVDVLSDAPIVLPAGARILSQSLSADRLAIHVILDGEAGEAILIHSLTEGRIVATLPIRTE